MSSYVPPVKIINVKEVKVANIFIPNNPFIMANLYCTLTTINNTTHTIVCVKQVGSGILPGKPVVKNFNFNTILTDEMRNYMGVLISALEMMHKSVTENEGKYSSSDFVNFYNTFKNSVSIPYQNVGKNNLQDRQSFKNYFYQLSNKYSNIYSSISLKPVVGSNPVLTLTTNSVDNKKPDPKPKKPIDNKKPDPKPKKPIDNKKPDSKNANILNNTEVNKLLDNIKNNVSSVDIQNLKVTVGTSIDVSKINNKVISLLVDKFKKANESKICKIVKINSSKHTIACYPVVEGFTGGSDDPNSSVVITEIDFSKDALTTDIIEYIEEMVFSFEELCDSYINKTTNVSISDIEIQYIMLTTTILIPVTNNNSLTVSQKNNYATMLSEVNDVYNQIKTSSGTVTGSGNDMYTDSGYNDDLGSGYDMDTDSGYTDSGYTDSGYTDSGYTDSGYTDSGYTDSGYTDSGYTDSGNGFGSGLGSKIDENIILGSALFTGSGTGLNVSSYVSGSSVNQSLLQTNSYIGSGSSENIKKCTVLPKKPFVRKPLILDNPYIQDLNKKIVSDITNDMKKYYNNFLDACDRNQQQSYQPFNSYTQMYEQPSSKGFGSGTLSGGAQTIQSYQQPTTDNTLNFRQTYIPPMTSSSDERTNIYNF